MVDDDCEPVRNTTRRNLELVMNELLTVHTIRMSEVLTFGDPGALAAAVKGAHRSNYDFSELAKAVQKCEANRAFVQNHMF